MRTKHAFTLVELLAVVAIMGILIALLLPAVQAAREASRLGACRNNLKQIGTALLVFHDVQNKFPQGGWGHEWTGVSTRGVGLRQPGGWIYSLLPYIEQGPLWELGASGDVAEVNSRLAQPLAMYNCPSRRPLQPWPVATTFAYVSSPKPVGAPTALARSDYAINSGATIVRGFAGPISLSEGDDPKFSWPDMIGSPLKIDSQFTGISHVHASTSIRRITDGTSNTYLVGEKYLEPSHYTTGESHGDNDSLYAGYCSDNHRFTELSLSLAHDGNIRIDDSFANYRFGSAHAAGANLAKCDGSVSTVSFDISPEAHYRSGHAFDGDSQLSTP